MSRSGPPVFVGGMQRSGTSMVRAMLGSSPELAMYEMPGVSVKKNPDNVLTASKAVSADMKKKIQTAAINSSSAFGKGAKMMPFSASKLGFTLELMTQGKINPKSYSW